MGPGSYKECEGSVPDSLRSTFPPRGGGQVGAQVLRWISRTDSAGPIASRARSLRAKSDLGSRGLRAARGRGRPSGRPRREGPSRRTHTDEDRAVPGDAADSRLHAEGTPLYRGNLDEATFSCPDDGAAAASTGNHTTITGDGGRRASRIAPPVSARTRHAPSHAGPRWKSAAPARFARVASAIRDLKHGVEPESGDDVGAEHGQAPRWSLSHCGSLAWCPSTDGRPDPRAARHRRRGHPGSPASGSPGPELRRSRSPGLQPGASATTRASLPYGSGVSQTHRIASDRRHAGDCAERRDIVAQADRPMGSDVGQVGRL